MDEDLLGSKSKPTTPSGDFDVDNLLPIQLGQNERKDLMSESSSSEASVIEDENADIFRKYNSIQNSSEDMSGKTAVVA